MTEDELHRVMIFRQSGRTLEDACETCRLSLTYCHANADINRQRCCDNCTH